MHHSPTLVSSLPVLFLSLLLLVSPALEAQTFRTDDPVLRQMWEEGMERSQTEPLAQALMDSIGPRLSGAPGFDESAQWLKKIYGDWGIEVRREDYGTWRGWTQGRLHVNLTSPRIQTLEAKLLAWSPGTPGTIEGEVVPIPEFDTGEEMERWLETLDGKIVLASAPEPTCREPQVSIALSCEDYGLVYRLTDRDQGARLEIYAEAEDLGTVPMYNVIAEIPGTELPDEYVMLSAHLDSWHGATGATDNGTGTITMLEAMRILKEAYPNPRRTILVGHWGGEEQGLIGSRAFTEDHEHIELDFPGPQEIGGSDHVAFLCHGAPGWRLQSHYPEYRQYTWHTNRDTYDKIVFDDLRNNATLAAMLAYLASEDPERVPRDRALLPEDPRTGEPREWLPCRDARRSWEP